MTVITVQTAWRSYRCRKRVLLFSRLPLDVWRKILFYLLCDSTLEKTIERILLVRLQRLYWTPPRFELSKKLKTLNYVRRYKMVLRVSTIHEANMLALRLVHHCSNWPLLEVYMINGLVEDLHIMTGDDCGIRRLGVRTVSNEQNIHMKTN